MPTFDASANTDNIWSPLNGFHKFAGLKPHRTEELAETNSPSASGNH